MFGASAESGTDRFHGTLSFSPTIQVSQAKNQHVVLFLAFLVSRGLFLSASLNFLLVGHTHEDLGDQG
jgi:hypothetical protein